MPDPLIGHSLGPYKIKQRLDAGGMAVVYLARRGDRLVALKVLRPDYSRDQAMVRRFMQEANAMAQLKHPHITPVYDAAHHGGRYYLAMAYMPRGSLKNCLDRQYARSGYGLSIAEGLAAVIQAAEALAYAHQRGVVHRDIKPSNLLLSDEGQIKLADFGAALAVSLARQKEAAGSGLTGTAAYIAPEQVANADQADHRADIYALGLVLYELLTGRPAFAGEVAIALLHQQIYETPPPLRQINPGVPASLQPIIDRALQKDPRQRYQSMLEFQTDLQRALANLKPKTARLRPAAGQGRPQANSAIPLLIQLPAQGQPAPVQAKPVSEKGANYNWVIILVGLLFAGGVLWFLLKDVNRPVLPAVGAALSGNTPGGPTPSAAEGATPTLANSAGPDRPASPTASRTATPSPTRRRTATPSITITPTATLRPPLVTGLATPSLLEPPAGETIYTGRLTTFSWKWPGELPEGYGFEVRIWHSENEGHPGAFNALEMRTNIEFKGQDIYQVTFDPAGAASVLSNRSQTNFRWTVAVVPLEPYDDNGPEAASRPVIIVQPAEE